MTLIKQGLALLGYVLMDAEQRAPYAAPGEALGVNQARLVGLYELHSP
jgi:hypothetical protein